MPLPLNKQGRTRLQNPINPQGGFPPAILHVGFYQKTGAFFCQQQPWPFLHTSLFCAPSIISQAPRAAMVAAEVPLRGKLRAEATHFPPTHSFCNCLYHCLQELFVQGNRITWRPRIAPCSTHGQNWRGKPRVFCWVRVSDLESGGARCARRP